MTTTKAQSKVIAAATNLRAKAFAVDNAIGVEFAVALSDGWKRHGVAGVRAACWSLAEMVAEVPGAWDLYTAARNLGFAC